MNEDNEKIAESLLTVSPPAIISTTTLLGIPLSDWVYISTIIYTIVGICTIIKKHWIDPWRYQNRRLLELEHRRKIENELNQKGRTLKSDSRSSSS